MLASTTVISTLQQYAAYFQGQVNNDLIWVEVNRRLVISAHRASYLTASADHNTLTLYDYNDQVMGTYQNNPAAHTITYADGTAGLGSLTYNNVNAVFSYPQPPPANRGIKKGRHVEAVIDYTIHYTRS